MGAGEVMSLNAQTLIMTIISIIMIIIKIMIMYN